MKKKIILGMIAAALGCEGLWAASDSIDVTLQQAGRSLTYKSALIVDGEQVTLKNKTLTATEGNQIAVLVVNGGKLVLDHCTIEKTGDGIRSNGGNRQMMGQGGPGQGGQGGPGMGGPGQGGSGNGERMTPPDGMRPPMDSIGGRPQRPEGQGGPGMGGPGGQGRPGGQGGPGMGGPGMGGPGGGDDGFNFYGTNSAVVALGKGTTVEMIGCTVKTDAEYANAVFAADEAEISITDGITIRTTKGSSRGLFATCQGVIRASGVVDIDTKGAHCAALATDRGGGTVTVGSAGTKDQSILNTAGDGSPCIYSTGDISAYNAVGNALTSQTMVIEGKNSITVADCKLQGNSPKHGGIMLYQSMSGDAEVGTSVLNMTGSTIQNNSQTPMILVTNTHTVVNLTGNTFVDGEGKALTKDSEMITLRNCNNDGGAQWGREGSNGGQLELNLKGQNLTGRMLAKESDSRITLTADAQSDTSNLSVAEGAGVVK